MKCIKCFTTESIENFINCNNHVICKDCKTKTSIQKTVYLYNFSIHCPCCL